MRELHGFFFIFNCSEIQDGRRWLLPAADYHVVRAKPINKSPVRLLTYVVTF
jgi:hypothetical protein